MVLHEGIAIKIRLIFLMMCLVNALSAHAMRPYNDIPNSIVPATSRGVNYLVILTGGETTSLGKQSQTLDFANTFFKYDPSDPPSFRPMIGGFIGAEYLFNKKWGWQFGLAYYQTTSSSVNGTETQAPTLSLDAINTWNYHYKILSRQLLFENKLFFNLRTIYHPYVLIGVGEGFNHAYAFQVSPQNSGEVATAIFGDSTNSSFIGSLGLGVDIDILKHMRIGAGYRFTYLGKYDLGKGTLNTGAGGNIFSLPALTSARSFNHALLMQLTYLI